MTRTIPALDERVRCEAVDAGGGYLLRAVARTALDGLQLLARRRRSGSLEF
jgi:hypothetical protein